MQRGHGGYVSVHIYPSFPSLAPNLSRNTLLRLVPKQGEMPTAAFDKAAEISRNDKSGKVSTDDILRGYGLYKAVTSGVGAQFVSYNHQSIAPHALALRHRWAPVSVRPLPRGTVTALAGPDAADCPGVLNLMAMERRQKWLAHEAAWEECGGDLDKAQVLPTTRQRQPDY